MKFLTVKTAACLMTAALLLTFPGCAAVGGGEKDPSSASGSGSAVSSASAQSSSLKNSLSLAYAFNRSLNPFTADSSINLALWPLMYDCLSRPSSEFAPENVLASSIRVSGVTVTVRLTSGVRFTDGSSLGADDVKYSFGLAMSNANCPFYSRVSNIAAISVPDRSTVVFTLKTPDPLFPNLLDVPVVKTGSGTAGIPIGSGRYSYRQTGNNAVLTRNDQWFGNKMSKIKSIRLIDMPDDDAVLRSFGIGTLDLYSNGAASSAATINADCRDMDCNQLLYLGVNSARSVLSDAHVRKAISLILDRQSIVREVYSSHALASVYPFNPSWEKAPKQAASQFVPNYEAASRELALAGFRQKNSNGILIKSENGVTSALELSLLVNKENASRMLAAQKIVNVLKNAGISLKTTETDFNSYTAALGNSDFDLYLGEIRLPADLDLSAFSAQGNAAASGIASGSRFFSSFASWRSGRITLPELLSVFQEETPFIPICYSYTSISFRKGCYRNVKIAGGNLFYNIEDWNS